MLHNLECKVDDVLQSLLLSSDIRVKPSLEIAWLLANDVITNLVPLLLCNLSATQYLLCLLTSHKGEVALHVYQYWLLKHHCMYCIPL